MNKVQKRTQIVVLKKEGFTNEHIADRAGVHKSTVKRVWKKYNTTGLIDDLKRSGRPQILSPRKKRLVTNTLKKGLAKTATGIQKELRLSQDLQISRQTVARTLNEQGYVSRVKSKKPLLSSKHIKARFKWAKSHENWEVEDWKNVVWSDETKFNLLNSDGKEYYWTNKPGILTPESVKPTLKYGGGSVMIWGCMTWEGLGFSCKIDGNMDGELYSEILNGELMQTYDYYNLDINTTIFQHDNDPKHKSKRATSTIQELGLKVLDWPSQSPDMNPIEHLWNHIDLELRKRSKQFSSKNELWEVLQDILKEKDASFCQKLISSMPKRVQDLKNARGGYTRW